MNRPPWDPPAGSSGLDELLRGLDWVWNNFGAFLLLCVLIVGILAVIERFRR